MAPLSSSHMDVRLSVSPKRMEISKQVVKDKIFPLQLPLLSCLAPCDCGVGPRTALFSVALSSIDKCFVKHKGLVCLLFKGWGVRTSSCV